MRRALILQAIVWLGLVVAGWGTIKYWPDILRLVRGNDCLDQYSLSGETKLPPELDPNSEHIWVLSKGKLYWVTPAGATEVCATGDPENPAFEVKR